MIATALSINVAPLLPVPWVFGIGAAIFLTLLLSLIFYRRNLVWRVLTAALFFVFLLNPSLMEEKRSPVKNVAVILVDESPSQAFGERTKRTEDALQHLRANIEAQEGMETRIVRAPKSNGIINETRLFDALDTALSDVPQQRRAGVVILTDGQVHDTPATIDPDRYGPVHVLLSGRPDETDRQLVVVEAPAFGIVDQDVTITLRVEDSGTVNAPAANIRYTGYQGQPKTITVPAGEDFDITLPVTHAGDNVFEVSTPPVPGELTAANNKTAIVVNGVRDRMKVLLVSGRPHAGGRTWRDLLTSDPGVDLVHFTILREPRKLDATPQHELALIAFPFRELFEIKLYDFDLIIFDRYQLNRILPQQYFNNIAKYVEQGGALLESSGPSFAGQDSIYNTSLMTVLPDTPTERIIKTAFKPSISDAGLRHPVTQNLQWRGGQNWGPWLRQVEVSNVRGDILMHGAQNKPLLILDRVGEGRVAHLTSDHIWLWSRGYEGGGPHAELLRRVVHWLMKEPELDEQALRVTVAGNTITLTSPVFAMSESTATMTHPNGTTEKIRLSEKEGQMQTSIEVETPGVYGFVGPNGQKRTIVVGDINPPELRGVVATANPLAHIAETSRGGVLWLSKTAKPKIKFQDSGNSYAGRDWIALKNAKNYNVTGVTSRPAFPAWFILLLLMGMVTFTWWREGRS